MARFWMAELSCGGIFSIVDVAADDGKRFEKGKVLYRYSLTDFGQARVNELLGLKMFHIDGVWAFAGADYVYLALVLLLDLLALYIGRTFTRKI